MRIKTDDKYLSTNNPVVVHDPAIEVSAYNYTNLFSIHKDSCGRLDSPGNHRANK